MFRRECFAEIGGYLPRKIGGVDLVAVTTARMKGWHTRTFLEKPYVHHRVMGTATASLWRAPFKVEELTTSSVATLSGNWHDASIRRHDRHLIGGILRLAGFAWAMLSGAEKQVPLNLSHFGEGSRCTGSGSVVTGY